MEMGCQRAMKTIRLGKDQELEEALFESHQIAERHRKIVSPSMHVRLQGYA